jgi:xylulokinase
MAHCLGLDLGTSALKALVIDEDQAIRASVTVPLAIARPHPLWSEQDPEDWWKAVEQAVAALRRHNPEAFADIAAIGLAGQMHAAVLLDRRGQSLRPAILWNDGRAFEACERLARDHADLIGELGVAPMPGFTAPKMVWLAEHEPAVLGGIAKVLLAKDFIRYRLTGDWLTDRSDAAGTWWLDQANRCWSTPALAATGVDPGWLPGLVEGSEVSGRLRPQLARLWGLRQPVGVAGGAGDVAAAAIGLGAIADGNAFLSLGTSAQVFVTTNAYRPAEPSSLVHAFCHALPQRWFQMGALLNGASCLSWAARLAGRDLTDWLAKAPMRTAMASDVFFLPYLSGERTPHNDPHARGVLFGLTPDTDDEALLQAVLEGVAFACADATEVLRRAGTKIERASLTGGGALSLRWAGILADVLDMPLTRHRTASAGPALGAARLAMLAATGQSIEAVCKPPAILDVIEPRAAMTATYRDRHDAFRRLYTCLRAEFRAAGAHAERSDSSGPV